MLLCYRGLKRICSVNRIQLGVINVHQTQMIQFCGRVVVSHTSVNDYIELSMWNKVV